MNAPQAPLIGQSVKRREDARFLTGRGQYTDDIVLPRQAYAVFVRSPYAHAKLGAIDSHVAIAMPGVLRVLTAADFASFGGLPCGWLINNTADGTPMKEPKHPILAEGKVRYCGEAVALVVAHTLAQAKAAAAAVLVDYEELPAVADTARAEGHGTALHAEAPDNLCYRWAIGDDAATTAAFAKAAHVTRLNLVNNRLIPNAIEPRAANASYDPASDSTTLYVANQNPHVERLLMCAFVLGIPEHKLRVIAPDVGGGWLEDLLYAEETALVQASRLIGRPVKWTAERSESFLTDAHGRDHVTEAALALAADGEFLGMRVKTTANLGAYLSTFASCVPTILYATLLAGQYRTPAIHCEVSGVFTSTAPVDAYRGAGRPEATYVVERLVDTAARELRMDPAALRRRNFIKSFPYNTPVGLSYDVGDYEATLAQVLELADVQGFAARKAVSESRGLKRGIGYSCYIEACGLAPSNIAGQLGARAGLFEAGEVRVHPTGKVSVFTGSHSHGQGHETTFAQVVADRLGLPIDDIEIVHGDTGRVPFGMGTYGSRSLAVGGSALVKALDKVIAKGRKIAAHLLEAAEADIVFEAGQFRVRGTGKAKAFAEVSLAAYVPHNYPLETLEPGLNENAFYDPTNFTYPAGSYVCEVEIDPTTGAVSIERFSAVDDFGNIVNPMIVEGQVHGGIAQGLGQALLEQGVYDPGSGQLLTGSYLDYAMPRADDLPLLAVRTATGTPCTHNPLGVKGCGEAGAIGSPAALMNAICDALQLPDVPMPASPFHVWRALQATAR